MKLTTKIRKVMHEYKAGSLKTSAGKKVKSRKQAVAIALSEARSLQKRQMKRKHSGHKCGCGGSSRAKCSCMQ